MNRLRLGDDAKIIGHEWGEPFEIGGVRVSLHPAGHIRGSAQVRVEHKGEVSSRAMFSSRRLRLACRSIAGPIPGGSSQNEVSRLEELLIEHEPTNVWILGDFVHHPSVLGGESWKRFERLGLAFPYVQFRVVRGNHDRGLQLPASSRVEMYPEGFQVGPFTLSHYPAQGESPGFQGMSIQCVRWEMGQMLCSFRASTDSKRALSYRRLASLPRVWRSRPRKVWSISSPTST